MGCLVFNSALNEGNFQSQLKRLKSSSIEGNLTELRIDVDHGAPATSARPTVRRHKRTMLDNVTRQPPARPTVGEADRAKATKCGTTKGGVVVTSVAAHVTGRYWTRCADAERATKGPYAAWRAKTVAYRCKNGAHSAAWTFLASQQPQFSETGNKTKRKRGRQRETERQRGRD